MNGGDYGQLESAIHSLSPPHLCKPGELCPTRSCMDLQVKHINWLFLLTGSLVEQLALLQGGLELLFLATASQSLHRAKSRTWSITESPALGLCPDLTTKVLPHQDTGRIQGMQGVRESQQWRGTQCFCVLELWHHCPITAAPSPTSSCPGYQGCPGYQAWVICHQAAGGEMFPQI